MTDYDEPIRNEDANKVDPDNASEERDENTGLGEMTDEDMM